MPDCPFCTPAPALYEGHALHSPLAHVRQDKYPVSPGHLLIIPNRHVSDWFALTAEEQAAVMQLVNQAKQWLEQYHKPVGYNIGMNCGDAAGQTVMHMHCHLIPRYRGDCKDPRGGIRWVLPEQAPYWENH
ncbi:MAG: HIT family protein [Alcanivoracaceae bacterium]